jgi:Ubiquitin-binding domain
LTGRPEIWQTLRAALDVLWTDGDDVNHDGGVATAQKILDAAGITLPTGDMVNGAYDGFGAFYALPECIVSDPTNLVSKALGEAKQPNGASDEVDTDRLTSGKGKKVVNPEDMVTVKARRSDGVERDLVIRAAEEDSVRSLTQRFTEELGVSCG